MASGNFQIAGISSGFDTESIISKLMEVQKKPITAAQSRQATATKEQAAWRTLNSKLLALDSSAKSLADPSSFKSRSGVSSNEDVFTVSADSGTDLGTFSVTVKQLAQQHQMISTTGFATQDQAVGVGTVTLQVGSAQFDPITLNSENNSLSGLRDAINAANIGVSASVLDAGEAAGSDRYKLVLNSKTSGLGAQIQITTNLSGGSGLAMTDLQTAQDAQVVFGNGPGAITVNSASNKVTGVLPGVTLELHQAQPDKAESLTLSRQSTTLRAKVEGFLDSYNSISSFFDSQFSYDSTTGAGGPLFGDSVALSVQNDLNRAATDSRQVGGKFSNLEAIGISIDKTGKLAITDESLFSKAMDNPEDVQKLFADEQFGVATKVSKLVNFATDSVSGTVTMQDKLLSEMYDNLDKEIAILQDRANRAEELYRLKFSAMETAMSELKSQSTAVAASLGTSSSSSSK